MHFEIGTKARYAVIEDDGIHITEKKVNHFLPFNKIISISIKKPSFLVAGHIFFRTAADGNNPIMSQNTILFTGKENYEIACKIKEAVEKIV